MNAKHDDVKKNRAEWEKWQQYSCSDYIMNICNVRGLVEMGGYPKTLKSPKNLDIVQMP